MTPLRLRAENFRTFGSLDIEFERGLIGILGELRDAPAGADSNGAGKSSILEAIDIALFGRRSLAGFLTRGGASTEMMLELTFEHAGDTYRVRRTFSAKGRGKTLVDLERLDLADLYDAPEAPSLAWTPMTCESAKATDALVCQTIGLSRDTFRNSSYLRQGDGSYADPARDPKQRKDLLSEAVLGADPVWPKLQTLAHDGRRTAELELQRFAGEADQARTVVAAKGDVELDRVETAAAETEAVAELATAETDLAKVTERYQAARDLAGVRAAAAADLNAAAQSLEQLHEAQARVVEASKQLTVARDELATLPTVSGTENLVVRERELLAAVAAHDKATFEHRNAVLAEASAQTEQRRFRAEADDERARFGKIRAAIAKLEATPHDEATCDRCKQQLVGNARALAVESMGKDANAHAEAADRLRAAAAAIEIPTVGPAPADDAPTVELETVRAQLAAAQQAQQQRVRLEERIANYEAAINAEPDIAERIALAVALAAEKRTALDDIEPVDLTAIEASGALCRANVTAARAAVEAKRIALTRIEEKLKAVTVAEERLAELEIKSKLLRNEVDVTVALERACGRDGVPALILENSAIPYLEVEASRILAALGTSYRVELRTQAALKSGDGLKDTLDVVILDETGEAPYDDFSGGEQTRIGLALRIALARLLAHRRGAESRLLALDEPSYLDGAGMAVLIDVLATLLDDFDTILVVSHVPELRDSLDQTITVVKDGGRSRIDGAPVREAVPA